MSPVIFWIRRDLRLSDHPGLSAVADTGRPVIPLFIHDEIVETHGAAPKWRLGLGVAHFAKELEAIGSQLILRRGAALDVLRALIEEIGAGEVHWSRAYDPDAIARDTKVKSKLKSDDIEAVSHKGHLLFEPWTVETNTGGFYRVFTPMWKSVRNRELSEALPKVSELEPPETWPESEKLSDWNMGAEMQRGTEIVSKHIRVGEDKAQERLSYFIEDLVADYDETRDIPSVDGTSTLSENLTYGEISPRQCWHAGWAAVHQDKAGAETFLKELVWREFAYQLAYHTPRITTENWRSEWDEFPWSMDDEAALPWKQGRTGIQLVDAAMRELYVTGTMHNRGRMIVASYLTKHMMTHWKIGLNWFEDCLIDWDPASNAMGWQWAAGSGPDASPYFRVFNPDTQAEKFDKDCSYRARYIAELFQNHDESAKDFFEAIPRSWGLSEKDDYPDPIVELDKGRARALEAYKSRG